MWQLAEEAQKTIPAMNAAQVQALLRLIAQTAESTLVSLGSVRAEGKSIATAELSVRRGPAGEVT
jgi:hypothetical protein